MPLGPRQPAKLCRSTRSRRRASPSEGCRHIGRRHTNEKGRGRGAGAFLAQVRSGCGAGAQHLAVVACRRSGCRFQGMGMNEHLVANVARRDRPVENSRRRFCPGAPLSPAQPGGQRRCRGQLMAGTNGAGARAPMSSSGFCGFATLSGGPYLRWQRRARGAVLDNGKACALAMPGVRGARSVSCAEGVLNLMKRPRR